MCINLLVVNTNFKNSSHAKVQILVNRLICPTSLGVAPLEVIYVTVLIILDDSRQMNLK